MTSISSSNSTPMPFVQQAVQRDAAAGSISATDQTALTAAIGDISSELQAGATGTAATATTASTTTAPTSMKDRVDGLIDDQVSSGKLTADQGSELKSAFAEAHAHVHGGHGHHGGGGGGGLDSLLASLTGSSSTDGTTTDPVTGATTTSSTAAGSSTDPLTATATTAAQALQSFLSQFASTLGSNGTYGANGQSSSSLTSLFVNSIG